MVLRILRLYSGPAKAYSSSAPAYSPSAQVNAAVTHVRRRKRNQRQGKLILSLWVFLPSIKKDLLTEPPKISKFASFCLVLHKMNFLGA